MTQQLPITAAEKRRGIVWKAANAIPGQPPIRIQAARHIRGGSAVVIHYNLIWTCRAGAPAIYSEWLEVLIRYAEAELCAGQIPD